MRVSRLGRYPVKSFQGEDLDEVEVGDRGVEGDRRWGVVPGDGGKVLSAKREGRLLEASARLDDGRLVVGLPGRPEMEPGDELDAALRQWLGRDDVSLRASDGQGPTAYEMNVSAVNEDSRLVEIPCPPGTFLDFAAVHLLTTASVAAAAAEHPSGAWDVARFRPTVLVDDAGEGFVEDDWVGRTVCIGDVRLTPFMPTIRCALTTRAQGDLPRDLDIARTVLRVHKGNLGVYAGVAHGGTMRVGDAVTVE